MGQALKPVDWASQPSKFVRSIAMRRAIEHIEAARAARRRRVQSAAVVCVCLVLGALVLVLEMLF